MAILTFAGKDASAEFNMIHPPNVVEKYAPWAVIGRLSTGAPSTQPSSVPGGAQALKAPLLSVVGAEGSALATEQWWSDARNTSSEFGFFGPSMSKFFGSVCSVVLLLMIETLKTIFAVKNYSVPHDKSGLTRSAIFLMVFVVIHGLGNLHVFAGPDAFNGYAYFLNRPVPWDTLLLPVEIYLLMAGMLHVFVATLRTIKFKKMSMLFDSNMRGQLSMAISGFVLLVFLIIHLTQFRLVQVFPSYTFRVKWMYPFYCDRNDTSCPVATFKDLYRLELEIFEDWRWVAFYLFSVIFFVTHVTEGWGKIINASARIPRKEKGMARFIGTALMWFIGFCYLAFPVFCYLFPVKDWSKYQTEHVTSWQQPHP